MLKISPETYLWKKLTPLLGLRTVFTGVFGNEHFVRTQKPFGSRNLTLKFENLAAKSGILIIKIRDQYFVRGVFTVRYGAQPYPLLVGT